MIWMGLDSEERHSGSGSTLLALLKLGSMKAKVNSSSTSIKMSANVLVSAVGRQFSSACYSF
jgi:hypothetical protein